MARPVKTGLDYFSLDVNLDDNVELMEAACGLQGFAIMIKLWQKIYSEGYFIDWKEDNALLFSRKINTEVTLVNSVVIACLSRGIFNNDLYERFQILTSKGIQKRYLTVCKQLKRTTVPFCEDYLLVNPELTGVSPEYSTINSAISTQKKGKEKKGKEMKGEETIEESLEDSNPIVVVNGDKELNIFQEYEKAGYGTISSHLMEELQELEKEYSTVWVVDALKLGAEQGKCKVSYVKGILKNWKADGRDAKKPTTYYKGKEVKADFKEREYDYSELEKKLLGGRG